MTATGAEPTLLLVLIQFSVYGAAFEFPAAWPGLYLLMPAVLLLHTAVVVADRVLLPRD
jgi:hypothetical protein